ncbi:hypothetical protein ACO0QE_003080 [Hanseniaspora vineae]
MKYHLPNTQPPYSNSRSNNASHKDSLKSDRTSTTTNGRGTHYRQEQNKESTDVLIDQSNGYKSNTQLADVIPQAFKDLSFGNRHFLSNGMMSSNENEFVNSSTKQSTNFEAHGRSKNTNYSSRTNTQGLGKRSRKSSTVNAKNDDRQQSDHQSQTNSSKNEDPSSSNFSNNHSTGQRADLDENDTNEYNESTDTSDPLSGSHCSNKSKKRLLHTNDLDPHSDKKRKASISSRASSVSDSPDVAQKKGRKLRKNYTLPPKPSKDDASYFMEMRKYRAAKEYLNNLTSTSLKQVALKHKISVPTLITYMDSERVKQFIKTGKYSGNAALKAKRNDKNQYNEHSKSNEQLLQKTKKRIALLEKFKNNIDLLEYLKAHENYDEEDPVFNLQENAAEYNKNTSRTKKSSADEVDDESELDFEHPDLIENHMQGSTLDIQQERNDATSAQSKSRGRQLQEQIENYDTPIFPNNENYELSDDEEVKNQNKYTVETFKKQAMNTEEKVSSIKKIINDITVNSSSKIRPIVPQIIHYAANFEPTNNKHKEDTAGKTFLERPAAVLNSSPSLPRLRHSQSLSKQPSVKPIKFKQYINDKSAPQSLKSQSKKTNGLKGAKPQATSTHKVSGPPHDSNIGKNSNVSNSELPAIALVSTAVQKGNTQTHQNNNHVQPFDSPTEAFAHPYTIHMQQQTPANLQARMLDAQQKYAYMNRDPTFFAGTNFVDQYGQQTSQNLFPFGFANFDNASYPNPVLPGVINGKDAYSTAYLNNTNQNNLSFSNTNTLAELRAPFQESETGPPLLHFPQQHSPHHPYNSHVYFPNHFDLKSPPAAPPVSASLQQYQAAINQHPVSSEMGSPPFKKNFGSPTQQGYVPASSRLNRLDNFSESAFQPFNDPTSDPEFSSKYNAIFEEFQKKFRDLLDGRSEDLQIYYARQMEQKMSTVFYPYSLESILKSRDHPQLVSKPNSRPSAHEFAPYIYHNATASSGYSVLDDMKNNLNPPFHASIEQRTNVPTLPKIPSAVPAASQNLGKNILFSPNSLNQLQGSSLSKSSSHYKKDSPMKKQKKVPEALNLNKSTPKKTTSKGTPFLSPPNTTTTSKNPDLSVPQFTPEGKKPH